MKRISVIVALVLVSGAAVHGQTRSLYGTVIDADTGSPLEKVFLMIEHTAHSAYSDDEGRFEIMSVPYGRVSLVVMLSGYEQKWLSIQVDLETSRLSVSLNPSSFNSDQWVVSGTLKPEPLVEVPSSMDVLTSRDIQFIPNYTSGELLARLTGVEYYRAGILNTSFNIRGFNNSFNGKNLHLTDGRKASLIISGLPFGPMDTVSPEDIDRQEIIRGPTGALYGPNAHAGLISTITKDPRTTEGTIINIRGGNQNSLHTDLRYAQVVSRRFAYKVNVSFSRADEFPFEDSVYVDLNGDGITEGVREYELDNKVELLRGSAALYFNVGKNADLVFDYGGSNSSFLAPTTEGRNQVKDWRIQQFQARFISPDLFAQVYYTLSKTDDTYSIRQRTKDYYAAWKAGLSPEDANAASLQGEALRIDDSRRINVEARYRKQFGKLGAMVGGEWERSMANSHGTWLLDKDRNDFIDINRTGVYGEVYFDFGSGFRTTADLRAEDHDIYGFNLLPKIGFQRLGRYGAWRLTYEKGIAPPSVFSMFANLEQGLLLGNAFGFLTPNGSRFPKAGVEKLDTIEMGYRGQPIPGRLYLDAVAYYSVFENFLQDYTVIGTMRERGGVPLSELQKGYDRLKGLTATFLNWGHLDAYGMDIGVVFFPNNQVKVSANYSWLTLGSNKDNPENDGFFGDGVVNKLDNPLNAPANSGSLGIDYKDSRWFGSTFVRWVEAYDYFSGMEVAAATQDLTIRGKPVVENTRIGDSWNYGALGGFVQVDAGIGYQVNDHMRLSAQVTNAFDAKIREFAAAPFIGRLVSAGIRFEF